MTAAVARHAQARSARWARAGRWLIEHRARILTGIALVALVSGALATLGGADEVGEAIWGAATALLAAELAFEVAHTIVRDRHMGVDTIALVAMVGALALGEELAGIVVGLMFTGGAALEDLASTRARRELTALIARAPKIAHLRIDEHLRDVPVEEVQVGDVALVRTGEVIPVDGTLVSAEAVIDTSTLSGEPLPVTLTRGMDVLSGSANAGTPFEVEARRPAVDSAYAALVRLVHKAQTQRAPFVRMADRYAGFFLVATLLLAGVAWAASGDAVRALAVVVVATPCPLILAAPIALVSGVSRAARAGVIVKGAGAIETLGAVRTILFDKTGTLTVGTPEVREILPYEGIVSEADGPATSEIAPGEAAPGRGREAGRRMEPVELLRMAASVDRLSAHVLGAALVGAAQDAELTLDVPSEVREEPGQGISGTLGERRIAVGSGAFLRQCGVPESEIASAALLGGYGSGEARVLVASEGHVRGVIVMADQLRADAHGIVQKLRSEGVRHVAMVSGDRRSVAERIGAEVGVDRVYAEQSPEEKLAIVRRLREDPSLRPVMMVGDGVNDAPALALADLGLAMGAAGATVSSETADAVITVDRVDRVADALHIGRRALHIARQSVLAGMAMSITAMGFAAAGYLTPVEGALLQEGIDLAVILNALRALGG